MFLHWPLERALRRCAAFEAKEEKEVKETYQLFGAYGFCGCAVDCISYLIYQILVLMVGSGCLLVFFVFCFNYFKLLMFTVFFCVFVLFDAHALLLYCIVALLSWNVIKQLWFMDLFSVSESLCRHQSNIQFVCSPLR